jgi:hypothetical protein
VTWLDEDGPPLRRELLHGRSREELREAVRRIRADDPARA